VASDKDIAEKIIEEIRPALLKAAAMITEAIPASVDKNAFTIDGLIREFNAAKETACWDESHPIFRMAEEIDYLRSRKDHIVLTKQRLRDWSRRLNGTAIGEEISACIAAAEPAPKEVYQIKTGGVSCYLGVVETREDRVLLKDIGGRSITNSAEDVVKWALSEIGAMRIFYIDSAGQVDELVHDGERFVDFGHGGWDE
jgi:hypothetical protein